LFGSESLKCLFNPWKRG